MTDISRVQFGLTGNHCRDDDKESRIKRCIAQETIRAILQARENIQRNQGIGSIMQHTRELMAVALRELGVEICDDKKVFDTFFSDLIEMQSELSFIWRIVRDRDNYDEPVFIYDSAKKRFYLAVESVYLLIRNKLLKKEEQDSR